MEQRQRHNTRHAVSVVDVWWRHDPGTVAASRWTALDIRDVIWSPAAPPPIPFFLALRKGWRQSSAKLRCRSLRRPTSCNRREFTPDYYRLSWINGRTPWVIITYEWLSDPWHWHDTHSTHPSKKGIHPCSRSSHITQISTTSIPRSQKTSGISSSKNEKIPNVRAITELQKWFNFISKYFLSLSYHHILWFHTVSYHSHARIIIISHLTSQHVSLYHLT